LQYNAASARADQVSHGRCDRKALSGGCCARVLLARWGYYYGRGPGTGCTHG